MGLYDNVPADPAPLSVTIDFSTYENGEKLSTLARNYHAKYAEQVGAISLADYFARTLFARMKVQMVQDAQSAANAIAEELMQQSNQSVKATIELLENEQLVPKVIP